MKKNIPSHKPKKSTSQHTNQQVLKVAVVVVAIVVVLSILFIFPKKQFAGKAVEFGKIATVGTAGVGTIVDNTIEAGKTFTLPVKVNIGDKKSVATHFKLTFPSSLLEIQNCAQLQAEENLEVIHEVKCEAGLLEVDVARLCDETCSNALSGEETIDVTFLAKDYVEIADKTAPLTFEEFTVLDLETNENLIKEVRNATITITKGKESACGNNKLDAGEFCDGTLFPEETPSDCSIYGFIRGNATCKADCSMDFTPCEHSKEGENCMVLALPGAEEGATSCGVGLKCEESKCVAEKSPAQIIIQLIPQTGNFGELMTSLQAGSLSPNNEYLVNVTIAPTSTLPANHLVLVVANYNDSIQKDRKMGTYPALAVGKTESSLSNTLITASSGNVTFEVLVWSSLPAPDETFTPLMERAAVTYAIK